MPITGLLAEVSASTQVDPDSPFTRAVRADLVRAMPVEPSLLERFTALRSRQIRERLSELGLNDLNLRLFNRMTEAMTVESTMSVVNFLPRLEILAGDIGGADGLVRYSAYAGRCIDPTLKLDTPTGSELIMLQYLDSAGLPPNEQARRITLAATIGEPGAWRYANPIVGWDEEADGDAARSLIWQLQVHDALYVRWDGESVGDAARELTWELQAPDAPCNQVER